MKKNSDSPQNVSESSELEFSKSKCSLAKDFFLETKKDFSIIDTKITNLIIFDSLLLGLFVEFIKIPSSIYGVFIYAIVIACIVVSLSSLIFTFSPVEFEIINLESIVRNIILKKESYIHFNNELSKNYSIANKKNLSLINRKSKILKISSVLVFLGLILIVILKILEQI